MLNICSHVFVFERVIGIFSWCPPAPSPAQGSVGQGGGTALGVQSCCWRGSVSLGPIVIAELFGFVLFDGARAGWSRGSGDVHGNNTKTREVADFFFSHVLPLEDFEEQST